MILIMHIGLYTAIFTPIIFLLSFLEVLKIKIQNKEEENYPKYLLTLIICVVSFWLIVVPLLATIYSII